MADQINMGGLSINDGAQQGPPQGNRSYIPPHMRGRGGPPPGGPQGGPPAMNGGPGPNGIGNSAWAK